MQFEIAVDGGSGRFMSEHEQWDIVSGVGITALAVALARAIESNRPDGLVDDPYARCFVADDHLPEPFASSWPNPEQWTTIEPDSWWDSMPTYMGVRSRFFDEFFVEAGAAGVRQAVIVAAGLDTRAYRLDWPAGTAVYEVDQPLVLKFKDEVLGELGVEPRCDRHVVSADLRDDWAGELCAAGFDPKLPTAWLAEGLLSFLPAKVEHELFENIRQLSAPGSRMAVEAVAGGVRHLSHSTPPAMAWQEHVRVDVTKLWNPEVRPEPVDVVRDGGWDTAVERIAEAADRYGRPVRGLMKVPAEHSMLLTATR